MAGFEKGDVIRVEDWPATHGRRFVVEAVVEVASSPFPVQVYAWEIQRGHRVRVFRAFPLERCRLAPRRRRAVLAAMLLVGVLVTARPALAVTATPETPGRGICSHIHWRASTEARLRLIRCAVRWWPVPGGWKRAAEIAACESYPWLDPYARTGSSVGVFQLNERWARAWWVRWGKPLGLAYDLTNARTNVIVAIRKANAEGWSAWSCA